MKFKLPIKAKMLKIKIFYAFKHSDVVFIMRINVKMPTFVVINNISEHDKFHAQLS